jgi:hypothetical protein
MLLISVEILICFIIVCPVEAYVIGFVFNSLLNSSSKLIE